MVVASGKCQVVTHADISLMYTPTDTGAAWICLQKATLVPSAYEVHS